MDNILDILIKKEDINKINVIELFNEWGGEKYSYEPPKFMYGSELVFHQSVDMKYYEDIVPDEYGLENSIVLTLEGNSLSKLEFSVNREKEIQYESELLSFIRNIFSSLETVCIIKLLNEEIIDDKYQLEDVNYAIEILLNSLNWEFPKGIVITKEL